MIDAEKIRAKIEVPQNLQEPYQRFVIAGLKVMFDEKTHQMMLDALKAEGPLGQKVGEGVAGLIMLLLSKSKGQPPMEILIPAGIEFVLQAFDYVEKTGMAQTTEGDVGTAMEVMIETLLKQMGANMDGWNEMTGGDAPIEGQMPQIQQESQPPQRGLIGGRMGGM